MTAPGRTRRLSVVGATMVLGVSVSLGWSSACSYEASLGSVGEPSPDSHPDAAIDAPPDAPWDAPPDAPVDASFALTEESNVNIDAGLGSSAPPVATTQ